MCWYCMVWIVLKGLFVVIILKLWILSNNDNVFKMVGLLLMISIFFILLF